jgi:putative flippase GtrA
MTELLGAHRRFSRFAGVGAIGFAVQLLVLAALHAAGVPDAPATALAAEAAVLNNFIWHERWTWRDRNAEGQSRPVRFVRYQLATGALALAGNTAITAALVELTRLPVVPANVGAVAVLSLAGFVVGDRWVFRTRTAEQRA